MTRVPDLLPGTLDMLILRTLQKEALHGWAISDRIQAISDVHAGAASHPDRAGADTAW